MHELLKFFQEQSSLYRLKEIGDGTHDFTKKVLEGIFGLTPKSALVSEETLFGDVLYDNFYIYEGSKRQGAAARRDFRCKINGQVVVLETEKLDNIEAGMKQIGGYMSAENTQYGIVTDGGIWRFFKHGADNLDQYEVLTIEQLCSTDGQAFLQNFYNSYDFYLNRLTVVQSKSFDTQIFHQGLITTAERVVFDLRHMGLFSGSSKEVAKEEIQTAYSLIIQILLIKIVQDKRKINLLKKDIIVDKLKEQDRNGIFEAVEGQLKWLGEFYKPYHNQQDTLLNTIIAHYQQGSRIAKLNLDSVRLFLDLYHFIYSFDFSAVKQDLFGAVYENYLKELYKDDDTKKGQVFTPPEIVEFMLDEVGYTVDYIQQTITDNLPSLKANIDDHTYNIDGLSLIDPACGSGTFLYKSAGRIVNALYNIRKDNKIDDNQAGKIAELLICNNIVGFDIEPFPLYLAEMNILQSLLFFNISADGNVINSIDQPIKIFSTQDSIAEFHNLESSMESDLQDLINGGEFATLASKRDPKSILQLKADLQDFDTVALMTKFQLALYHKALQNEFFIIDSGELIKTKNKTYRDKHHKKITNLTTIPDLLAYVRETLDDKYLGLFESTIKSLKTPLDHIISKLGEIISKTQTKRTKFDFVVANPPYVAYKSIPKEIMNNWSKKGLLLNDVFGINLHSTPLKRKTASPTNYINLYSYFNALGFFLLKESGKLCFILPEGFIGYDCNNYFLCNKVNLQEIIFFNTKVFTERGLNGKIEVGTSAIIYKYTKDLPNNDDVIIKSYQKDIEEISVSEIIRSLEKRSLGKEYFTKNIEKGFSILKINDKEKLFMLSQYTDKSDDFSVYYLHDNAKKNLGSEFYFDKGYKIEKSDYIDSDVEDISLKYSVYQRSGQYYNKSFLQKYKYNDLTQIPLYSSNQGHNLLKSRYKLIRDYIKTGKGQFCFEDRDVIRRSNTYCAIGSNNYEEIIYLFGLLNSEINQNIIDLYSNSGGVEANRLSLTNVKQRIRVPLLNTPTKLALKSDLIANSEAIITLCKQGSSGGPQTRGDICEMVWDPDSLGEKITGLKTQYDHLQISIPAGVQTTDILPDDVVGLLSSEISDLAKLETERDEIVKRLYELE